MDLYRALNADVPQLLFTVMHQSRPDVTAEDYLRMVVTLHKDVRDQFQAIEAELNLWLQKQYVEQAEEMVRKLQRLALLDEQVNARQAERVQEALMLDYRRLGSRIGSQGLVGVQGSGEEIIGEGSLADSDLASTVAAGHKSVTALGFLPSQAGESSQESQPGRGALHESWLLFRGSVHYDILEHVLSSRIESFEQLRESVACASFGMYELVYQIGEGLTVELRGDSVLQEVTILFSQETSQYSSLRQEVAALMEEVSEYEHLFHASFWHRKPALGASRAREFVLRLRLSGGEQALQEITRAIAATGEVGEKTIMNEGKMLLGRRVL